jgi:hypothetical protein
MKKFIWSVFVTFVMIASASVAHADSISAVGTADNNLFYWDSNTTSWQTLTNNWESASTGSINSNSISKYLYFAVSNDQGSSGNPAAFLASFVDNSGTFTQTGTNTLLSNTANWQIATVLGFTNPTTDPTTIGGWATPTAYGANNDPSTIWEQVNGGPISGINPNAQWIWTANNDGNFSTEDNYAYLRTDIGVTDGINPIGNTVVPEPPTVLLFLFAGALVVLSTRKRLFV